MNVSEVSYPLSFSVMPTQLGIYTITTTQLIGDLKSDYYQTLQFSASSSGGSSGDKGGCYDAPAGIDFDTEKSDFTYRKMYGGARNDHDDNIPNRHNIGIIKKSVNTGRRICFEITAAIGCNSKCAARTNATAQLWLKVRQAPPPPVTTATTPIQWESHTLPLLAAGSGKSQIISISIFGGSTQSYGIDQERLVGGRFLRIEPSPRQNAVFLRQREIE